MDNHEFPYAGRVYNGFVFLFIELLLFPLAIAAAIIGMVMNPTDGVIVAGAIGLFLLVVGWIIVGVGMFSQQPNQARVMIFFGKYRGTFTGTGYFWVNPFVTRKKISLRIRNMDVAPIKVNDKVGNPVMIGMVLVWKVRDTYRAVFDIDAAEPSTVVTNKGGKSSVEEVNTNSHAVALESFVSIQSDAALREVTGRYAYDDEDGSLDRVTLRSGSHEIVAELEQKLNERLSMAGIEVVEARLNYLAYAPEIAAVMLRRQQASAIIAAREKIVEGAVSMVEMALNRLDERDVVKLDAREKAAMVSNLLVVLCADDAAQPVVNAGA